MRIGIRGGKIRAGGKRVPIEALFRRPIGAVEIAPVIRALGVVRAIPRQIFSIRPHEQAGQLWSSA